MFHDVVTDSTGRRGDDAIGKGIVTGHIFIRHNAQLVEAIEMFQDHPDLRLLPVIDDADCPVGAIFERDIRAILFNPFGHALLKNPSFGSRLDRHIRPCPTIERGMPVDVMIERHAAEGEGCEGLMVTRSGRFCGIVPNHIILRLAAQREAQSALKRAARFERIDRASKEFREIALGLVVDLTSAADHLSVTAANMAERASHNGGESAVVAATTLQVAANMNLVAQRSRELAETLDQANQTSSKVKSATDNAVQLVVQSGVHTRVLADAADEIDGVTSLIDGIARKTHMLSINAAVEAARAGDAGRGFAVVASEVKLLAGQTRTAAADISRRIANIRTAISQVGTGHKGMENAITAVEGMSSSIMEAIDRQSAFTQSVATHIDEAAAATDLIHGSAGKISQNAMVAAGGADEMHVLAKSLSIRAQDLRQRVSTFLREVADA